MAVVLTNQGQTPARRVLGSRSRHARVSFARDKVTADPGASAAVSGQMRPTTPLASARPVCDVWTRKTDSANAGHAPHIACSSSRTRRSLWEATSWRTRGGPFAPVVRRATNARPLRSTTRLYLRKGNANNRIW